MTEPLLNFAPPVKREGGRSFYPNTIFKRQGNNYQDRVTPNLKILLRSSSSVLSSYKDKLPQEEGGGGRSRPPPTTFRYPSFAIICHSLRNSIDPCASIHFPSRSVPRIILHFLQLEEGYVLRYVFVRIRNVRVA